MKKTMKKFAAIIAAMMTVSALSSMSAFALETDHYQDGGNSKTANVDLQAKVSETQNTSSTGADDENANDTNKHIWNVTISADTLTWNLVKTDNTVYKQNVTWDPSTHTYVVTNGAVDTNASSSSYTIASTDTEAKTINVTNNSNFAITSSTTTADPTNESSYGASFSVTDPSEQIDVGGNANTAITINVSNMSGFDSEEFISVGTATVTLTAVENSIVPKNYNPNSGD